ncbi:LacI family DNA-binding transcriptional regulator [Kitasatospora cathayae]|uniref:LacI family DNA-binding transcriptional regulator n=1 Tax=Kitasatospora cathayae TaxID=3004092 RepID=A0ABY7QF83_9ACTN|nr:LacI family DNA-binding transcriptional regulator [Kitasatospora sp. HUAS 3-15]WBP91282.1 LacI family DNA-binding transcriptional regulator [Kitasatospora sp. HUAS 3-15]
MAASIIDVAQAVGVSPSTVSRALRGRDGVSDELRVRIIAVAADLGYTASRNASSLASGRTCSIGVLAPYVGRWFFGTVVDAAERVFSAAGYDLLLYNLGSVDSRKRFFAELPVRKRVDAILSLLIPTEDEAERLRSLGIPLAITVGGPRPGFTTVGIDDRAGAELATRHLVNLGHRRIGRIGTQPSAPLYWTTPDLRRRGYLDVLVDAGIPHDPDLEADGEYTVEGGERAMTRLLTAVRPPTAVFAESDEMAMGALRALRAHRLRVPEDIAIVGFDDHELADVVGLTTVAQPVAEHGTQAASLLLRLLRDDTDVPDHVELPTHLIVRNSTAPHRGSLHGGIE